MPTDRSHYNLPPYWDDVTGKSGSWSTRLQPYYPFWEFVGSSDFAYCPIEGVPQHWPEGGFLTGQAGDSASYCVVNGSVSEQIYDYRLATHTIATLQLAKREGKPFFVMAGFRRPHRDFLVHQQYWDMYPPATDIATAKYPVRSASQPLIAFHPAGFKLPNGTSYPGNPDLAWPVEIQQIARKAYYTAITQTDAQVGRVLDELDSLGYEQSTIVVVSADHGWQLGEHGLWDKQTEFELATRVPLLIKVPWAAPSVGKRFDHFVELVDLHATLADLAGLPATPPTALPESVMVKQSVSFAIIFTQPSLPFKNASFSQWPVCTKVANASCMACTGPQSSRAVLDSMGYSIRTDEWRLTIWLPSNN
eukprot:SAG31_NODE_2589_length_5427_cov_3.886449_1_plen_362_part_10